MVNYTGEIFPIPVGHGGLVGTKDQAEIAPDRLIVARNLSFEGRTLRKEGGATKYNSSAITAAPSVIGGWDWWPTDGTQRMVVLTNAGNYYKDSGDGTFPGTLASGLSVGSVVPVFVEGGKEAAANNRKLFMFTGKNAVQVLSADGATSAAISAPPADWTGVNQPSFGGVHENRLFGGGNLNDPHRVYFSLTTNHEDFTTTPLSFAIFPGEGEKLIGGLSFGQFIVLWKFPRGIYVIDTADPSSANWKVRRLTRAVGGVSPLGAVAVDKDIIFVDHTCNFHALSAVQESSDAASSNITRSHDLYSFIKENFNLGQLANIRGVYYEAKREAHFAIAAAGATTNSARFVVDFNRDDMARFRYSDRDVCQSLWLRKDTNLVSRLASGDNAGFVWNMDSDTKSKDGAGYAGSFQTPYMDFGWIDPRFATVRKQGEYLECVVEPQGNWNLSVDILWDGETVQTVLFNMGVSGAVLGSFVLGTDKLAGSQILNRKRRIVGSGRRLSLAGTNSGAGEDFSVGHFILHAQVGDERPGRDND
jgi:hypothetical protein